MRRDRWLAALLSAVLSFAIGFAGVMCLQSAFGLDANGVQVALGCALCAVAFSAGFTTKFWYIPLLLIAPVAGWLWQKGSLSGSVEYLLTRVSLAYHQAYDCGVLYWSEQMPLMGDATMALCAAGCIITLVVSWTVCRKKTALWSLLTAALPLAACFVVTDRVPRVGYLYLLLLGLVVLLICQLTRRKNVKQANCLVLLVTVPAALALLALFWAIPQDRYRGQERADRILETVQSWIEEISDQAPTGTSTAVQQTVELDQKGRLVQTHTPVMTVSVDAHSSGTQSATNTIYLRQQGFQMYDGTSWYNEWGNDIYEWIQWDQMQQTAQVMITTRNQYLMKFVPYYAKNLIDPAEGPNTSEEVVINFMGFAENLQNEYGYTFYLYQLKDDAATTAIAQNDGYHVELPVGTYSPDAISLPAKTVEWAEDVVAPLIAEQYTVKDRAEAIGAYVQGLARYDRNTARMPVGQTDFARWFVTEAESGYCVHYATAATVLLRAAGIQAQYVEGYVARVPQDGTAVTVYEDQAHAWVEYYDPAVGWRILECTPPEGVPVYVNGTQPPQSTEPQAPTQPSEQPEQENIPQPEQEKKTWAGWYWVLSVLAAAALAVGQWQLRLCWRRRDLARGTANQRAVKLWRRLAGLSRLLKKRPQRELLELAQKAKFSNHLLSARDLEPLEEALADCIRQLKAKPWYCQPVYTLILAVC